MRKCLASAHQSTNRSLPRSRSYESYVYSFHDYGHWAMITPQYSGERVTREDLVALQGYSFQEFERFLCIAAGRYAVYRERLIAICLCQDGARNYVIGDARINDLDVWFFFREHDAVKLPNHRNLRKSSDEMFPALGTIRIDFMKKAIPLDLAVERDIPRTI